MYKFLSIMVVACVACSASPSNSMGEKESDALDTTQIIEPEDSSTTTETAIDEEPTNDTFIEGRDCPEDSPFTWENFGEAIMLNYCTGCHSSLLPEGQRAGAPLDVDFNDHNATQLWLTRIYARSADTNKTMPPIDTMTDTERYNLGDWLACGAP